MSEQATSSRSVVLEREMPHAPEKIWRALTESPLLQEWLMNNDFQPVVGHSFKFSGDWGSVDCQVTVVEPNKTLAYTWGAYGLGTVVTWTLVPTAGGTLVRMEQVGFTADQDQAYQGAQYGWQRFFGNLEEVVAKLN